MSCPVLPGLQYGLCTARRELSALSLREGSKEAGSAQQPRAQTGAQAYERGWGQFLPSISMILPKTIKFQRQKPIPYSGIFP